MKNLQINVTNRYSLCCLSSRSTRLSVSACCIALASSSVFQGFTRIAPLRDCALPANSLRMRTPGPSVRSITTEPAPTQSGRWGVGGGCGCGCAYGSREIGGGGQESSTRQNVCKKKREVRSAGGWDQNTITHVESKGGSQPSGCLQHTHTNDPTKRRR